MAVDDDCKHVGVRAQCLFVDVSSLSCNTSYVDYQEEWFMVVPAIHEGFSHVTTLAEYHTLFDACLSMDGSVVFDISFSSSVSASKGHLFSLRTCKELQMKILIG